MEKIYHETHEKSGHYTTDSPCVSVQAFRPEGFNEEGLPAIIILEFGTVNHDGALAFNETKYIVEAWNHDGAKLIRKAINRFDAFRKRIYRLEGKL